jgi:ceramide kinase
VAGIRADVVMTERANHARDHLQDISTTIKDYDGVVCVGGDGMFSEMVNGMIVRTQLEQGVNYQSPEVKLTRPGIPIGVIPAGSTDAVAFGVTGVNDPSTCAIHVVFGKSINIDVSAVHDSYNEDRFLRYVTSVLGYGFLADVLLESEKNRWMGPKRYDWAGFKKLLSLKSYAGEIKLRVSATDGSPRDSDPCHSDCALCAKSLLRSKYSSDETSIPQPGDDPADKPPSSVLTIRGRFLAVNAATMACRCDKARKGLSPAAHLGNGCSDLIVVSECSRLDYIRFLMRTGLSTSQSPVSRKFHVHQSLPCFLFVLHACHLLIRIVNYSLQREGDDDAGD